jgi:hypothetical protein
LPHKSIFCEDPLRFVYLYKKKCHFFQGTTSVPRFNWTLDFSWTSLSEDSKKCIYIFNQLWFLWKVRLTAKLVLAQETINKTRVVHVFPHFFLPLKNSILVLGLSYKLQKTSFSLNLQKTFLGKKSFKVIKRL